MIYITMGLLRKGEYSSPEQNFGSKRVLLIDDSVSSQYSEQNYGLDILMRDMLAFIDPAIKLEVAATEEEAMMCLGINKYDLVILNFRLHGTHNTPQQKLFYLYGRGNGEGGNIFGSLKSDSNLYINRETPVIGFSFDWMDPEVRSLYNAQDLVSFSKPIEDMKAFIGSIKNYLNI